MGTRHYCDVCGQDMSPQQQIDWKVELQLRYPNAVRDRFISLLSADEISYLSFHPRDLCGPRCAAMHLRAVAIIVDKLERASRP